MNKRPTAVTPRQMRLSYRLRAAICQYYAYRNMKTPDSRLWPGGTAEKERCCQAICDEAAKQGISATIVPGTIFLNRHGKSMMLNGPVQL